MVSLPTSSDSDREIDYEEEPFEFDHMGFPEKCFCGADAILERKRSGPDAGRLYYRCANSQDQDNTVHLGKWFEIAVQEECRLMRTDISTLQTLGRVDTDYLRRVQVLEASHEKMETIVSWLSDEVHGWWEECKVMALSLVEQQKAKEKMMRRLAAVAAVAMCITAVCVVTWRTSYLG